ncbi:translocation/assembly module TamB domain-containing protein [Aliiglaciecola sp. LCG003]|uniref:autotransporter assembly complex protein TamB n=1 Tax=Aliiglaciecola sp. LCG003 TaxID=3053655 RepID=UPI002574629C|nr:translocation/assembly module TamB domain-containing protein [Aliiglaciecola sp. LCG003]WJG09089.1 translocation/assembly module TamB domain-containing protein [Aliiglaciecola sp. LCG003]
MKWLKIASYTFLLMLTLMVFVSSPWGTSLSLSILNSQVDGLEIKHDSGGLWGELKLSSVKWKVPGTEVKAQNIITKLSWLCSFPNQLCLDKLHVGKVTVVVGQQPPTAEQQSTATEKITLPFAVSSPDISIGNVNVNIDEVAKISWSSLQTDFSMHKRLAIKRLLLTEPSIVLAPVKVTDATKNQQPRLDINAISQWQYEPLVLPKLTIPLNVSVDSMLITKAKVSQQQQTQFEFDKLTSKLSVVNSHIQISELTINHPTGWLEGNLDLRSNYLTKANIRLKSGGQKDNPNTAPFGISLLGTQPIELKAAINGDLNQLSLRAELQGDIAGSVNASLQLANPRLPADIKIKWQKVEFGDDSAKQQLSIDPGNLTLVGDLNSYNLDLQTGVKTADLPHVKINLKADGNNRNIQLSQATVHTLNGQIDSLGSLQLTNKLVWQSKTQITKLKPDAFWPQLQGVINGNLQHNGEYSATGFKVDVTQLAGNGEWLGYPLEALGTASYDSVKGLEIPQLTISNGDNSVAVTAKMDTSQQIEAEIEFNGDDLAQLYPGIQGTTSLNAKITGSVAHPQINYKLAAHDLRFEQISLQAVTGKGDINWDEDKQIDIALALSELQINQEVIESISIALQGNAEQHTLNTKIDSAVIKLESQISGQLFESKWQGEWQKGHFKSQWGSYVLNQADTQILADWHQQIYRLAPHCWHDDDAQLCVNLAEFVDQQARFDLSGEKLELLQIVSQFLPEVKQISSDTRFFFNAKGNWRQGELPNAQIDSYLTPSQLTFTGFKRPIDMQKFAFNLTSDTQQVVSTFELRTQQSGSIMLTANLQDLTQTKGLEGSLSINNWLLSPYKELVPQLTELNGVIQGDLALSGSLDKPLLNGKLLVKDVVLAGDALPGRIDAWTQEVEFAGQKAKLNGEFLFGKGKGKSSGSIDWSEQLIGDIGLTGDNFELEYRDTVRARFSPQIQLLLQPESIKVDGKVDVFYARIKVKELPPDAQTPSDDEVIVNQPKKVDEGRPLDFSLTVNIDPQRRDDVKLEAFGLKTDLRGSLELKQYENKFTGVGDLRLINGKYRAYGQDLIIQKGEILFSGPMDSPTLDIIAIRNPEKTQDGVLAGIKVYGPSEQPSVEIYSEPTMVQSEALSYLLRGQSLGAPGQSADDQLLASVLLSAGLKGSENKVDQLGRKFGIEDLALGTSSDDKNGTQVSITGYIAPGVQLSYGVNVFDSTSQVSLRYQLLPSLYLKAISGAEDEVKIEYQFSLGERDTTKQSSDKESK